MACWHRSSLVLLGMGYGSWRSPFSWLFAFNASPGLSLRTALERHLGHSPGELEVLPATPPVQNHSRRGIPSRQVCLALPHSLLPGIPYLLDQRPVLLELVWAYAPGGRIDVAELYARHRHRCPATHFFRLLGGHAPFGTANQQRMVHPGQLLTVEYWRRRSGGRSASRRPMGPLGF